MFHKWKPHIEVRNRPWVIVSTDGQTDGQSVTGTKLIHISSIFTRCWINFSNYNSHVVITCNTQRTSQCIVVLNIDQIRTIGIDLSKCSADWYCDDFLPIGIQFSKFLLICFTIQIAPIGKILATWIFVN